ncbi:hypothetical protein ACQKMV_11535 [Lysinibacillus sp. NPDC094403]|uniref:hypothetical protein n=1 Tax=Lysinibacillus sp. NPDC094403 TaxID=3390581 RepID=UPI003CFE377E
MSANVAAAMFYLCESATTATTLAKEAARRSPAGSLALRESEASATKRVARSGNQSLQINKSGLKWLINTPGII